MQLARPSAESSLICSWYCSEDGFDIYRVNKGVFYVTVRGVASRKRKVLSTWHSAHLKKAYTAPSLWSQSGYLRTQRIKGVARNELLTKFWLVLGQWKLYLSNASLLARSRQDEYDINVCECPSQAFQTQNHLSIISSMSDQPANTIKMSCIIKVSGYLQQACTINPTTPAHVRLMQSRMP